MVLCKLPVPGRPTYLDYSRARAYCACKKVRVGFLYFCLSSIISLLSPSLWETARYRLIYRLKGLSSPKHPTNQPFVQKTDRNCMPCSINSSMTLQTEILSSVTSDFLKILFLSHLILC